jgi:ribonuclease P/MRP protein subunit RPP1
VKGIYGFSNTTSSLYPLHTTLLSSHPTTIGSFSHTCLSLSPPSVFAPSLVTFDPSLSARLPFLLKRGPVNTAQRAGLQFRIDWRGITRLDDPGDAAGGGGGVRRRNWTAGAREIVRATGGVGVVMCSMAREPGELRAPADMINLYVLLFLFTFQ